MVNRLAPLLLYRAMISPAFAVFRLVYIPATMLTYSGHGGVWLNMVLGLLLTFGGEWLGHRAKRRYGGRRQDLATVIGALLLLGLFPEESPVVLLLWTAIGLAWGQHRQETRVPPARSETWIGRLVGGALGLSGLLGPGSWLMGLLLLPLLGGHEVNQDPAVSKEAET